MAAKFESMIGGCYNSCRCLRRDALGLLNDDTW